MTIYTDLTKSEQKTDAGKTYRDMLDGVPWRLAFRRASRIDLRTDISWNVHYVAHFPDGSRLDGNLAMNSFELDYSDE
jgi:hypothetical protein